MISHAQGSVLEVGAGTCRNIEFYPDSVAKLTLTDQSINMLEEGKRKHKTPKEAEFRLMDGHKLDFPNDTFDTIVDTFGLCSFEKPEEVLQEMQRVRIHNIALIR